MTKKTAILSAVFALGVMFASPVLADGATKNGASVVSGCSTCSGGSGGAPAGYSVSDFRHATGSHGKNGGGSSGSSNSSSPYVDRVVCVIGPRVAYVPSSHTCRRLVRNYMAGHGFGEGGSIVYQSSSSHGVSKATRMQHKKRYAKAHRGKAHYGKVRHGHVAKARSRSGNTYNIKNYGTIVINKGGAW